MDNDSDQFLALQALNNVPGNVMALSPPSNTPSVHLQELSTGNSLAASNPGNLIDLDTIKEECIPYDEQGGGYGGPGSIKGEKEKGTFWPEKPKVDAAVAKASTVLTNLQRGNIPTIQQTRVEPVLISLHQRAGQGELRTAELEEDSTIVLQRDNKGKTPLMWSAAYGQTPTVSLLLRHGADVHARAQEDQTALHLASSYGHHDVVRILLSHGAHVDAVDENSYTPLMFAAMGNHPHTVNELLVHKANFTLTNINGDSALKLAITEKAPLAQTVIENHMLSLIKGISGKTVEGE